MDGVIVIDKPKGPTSHDIVAVVRRAIGSPRVGHTGTLDPLATGVLPLVLGRATRLASYMSGAEKEYVAQIRFGATTETYDAEPLQRGGASPSEPTAAVVAELRESTIIDALTAFTGRYLQTPPPYSAKKIAGKPAYKLAREQKPVEIKPVEVHVSSLVLEGYGDGLAQVRITSSAGFYVRSLAHDLGQRLGCGAYLAGLRRTRVGSLTLEHAISLDRLVGGDRGREEALDATRGSMVPLEQLLPDLPSVALTMVGSDRASHGNVVRPQDVDLSQAGPMVASSDAAGGRTWRLFAASGTLLGLAERRDDGLLHPTVVLV